MKIWFIMILAWPMGTAPPHKEPVESMELCLAKVSEVTKNAVKELPVGEPVKFTAACQIEIEKSDPA